MARNVYTVRVIEVPDTETFEGAVVPVGFQYVISNINATSNPESGAWSTFSNAIVVANLTTGDTIWTVSPIPDIFLTLQWKGRYVLEYGELLGVFCTGWQVAITAYSLELP